MSMRGTHPGRNVVAAALLLGLGGCVVYPGGQVYGGGYGYAAPPAAGYAPGTADGAPPAYFAQPGYAQPGYAQPGYAQPGYAQPGYAQPGYAQPVFVQPGYAQPVFVQPGYAGYAPGFIAPPVIGFGFGGGGWSGGDYRDGGNWHGGGPGDWHGGGPGGWQGQGGPRPNDAAQNRQQPHPWARGGQQTAQPTRFAPAAAPQQRGGEQRPNPNQNGH